MANNNSIALSKNYVALLDEVYKKAALTSVLDSDPTTAQMGANANEIKIPKLSMDGLGDYSRNGGYTQGDVNLTYETVAFNYDRGRKLSVDYLDNEETAEVAFGKLNAEFIRTKVAPESDAFTFATLAGKTGISTAAGTLSTGADVIAALATAVDGMTDDEVPEEGRILFITSALNGLIRDMDTTKSREVLASFNQKIVVPQSRFATAIELLDGKTSGEEAGGYIKAAHKADFTGDGTTTEFTISAKPAALQAVYVDGTKVTTGWTYAAATGKLTFSSAPANTKAIKAIYDSGADINFMIVHKPAVLKFDKHIANNIITPDANQEADAYMLKYRKYGLVDVYENKVAGIYCHHKAF